ncbi:unnamed protein product [Pleuronectes platessa]|uniref:Uncharacterized protein n=1 Tax=Pleuronectes platessa TaxID=8262 RepID=A0A9N7Y9W8_PLEPL|nr:unnamed protein product [Pleuronectes platessa]
MCLVLLEQWFLTWVRSYPRGSVSHFQGFCHPPAPADAPRYQVRHRSRVARCTEGGGRAEKEKEAPLPRPAAQDGVATVDHGKLLSVRLNSVASLRAGGADTNMKKQRGGPTVSFKKVYSPC